MSRPLRLVSHPFSAQLASRLIGLLGAVSLAAPHVACGTSGAASSGGGGTTTIHGSGGTGTTTAGTAGSGSTTTDTGLGNFDAGIPEGGLGPPPPGSACFDWPDDAGACPSDPSIVLFALDKNGCVDGGVSTKEASGIVSGPTQDAPGECCYVVDFQWCIGGGRPYLVGDHARLSPGVRAPRAPASQGTRAPRDQGWSAGARPGIEALDGDQRASLAASWTADALLEHASVASFSRFSLSLLAMGAPAELVLLAHRAALDEVRHARLCFALAAAYAGESVAPGPFPAGAEVEVSASLAALAASAFREGCVGETVAAVLAAEQHARATDPAVRAALAEIAADEARHAELAWRTVAWAIEAGGAAVRDAVGRAFFDGAASGPKPRPPAEAFAEIMTVRRSAGDGRCPSGVMEAHGRLDEATKAAVVASAIAAVVAPVARALLGHVGAS